MADQGPPRPLQVTIAGWLGVGACAMLVLSLFEAMSRTRTVAARDKIEELLARPPYDGLEITVDRMLDLLRLGLFGVGAVAAAGLVLGWYVLRRHNGARIGFTIAAALLIPAMVAPYVGLPAVLVCVAAVWLWSAPARDWFAGRTPTPRPTQPAAQRPTRPESMSSQEPPPAPYPFGSPPPRDPAPGAPPPSSRPSAGKGDEQQTPQPPEGGSRPQSPPSAPGSYPAGPPGVPPYAQPGPGHGAGGYPPGPYGQPAPWPPVGPGPSGGSQRPTSVVVACVLTWIFAGLVGLVSALVLLVAATQREQVLDEIRRQMDADPAIRDLGLSSEQLLGVLWAGGVVVAVWCLAAVVLAVFVFRRAVWARWLLVASSAGAALLSLVGIVSLLPILTLLPSVATIILLFTGGAGAWFAGREPGSASPMGYPRQNGPW